MIRAWALWWEGDDGTNIPTAVIFAETADVAEHLVYESHLLEVLDAHSDLLGTVRHWVWMEIPLDDGFELAKLPELEILT